jgi:hypothetical protein
MNASMFLPQVPEEDEYDRNGCQIDDINSVLEYFAVVLGYDHTPDDEDDDSGQNLHLVKSTDYNFRIQFVLVQPESPAVLRINEFPDYITARIEPVCYDVATPPPEA